jgi:hypothetical protein
MSLKLKDGEAWRRSWNGYFFWFPIISSVKQDRNFVLIDIKPVCLGCNIPNFELKIQTLNLPEFFLETFTEMATRFAIENQC